MMRMAKGGLLALAAAGALLGGAGESQAGRGKGAHGLYDDPDIYREVYAESEYSTRAVVAPVRRARYGDQVRLPGGTWIDCGRSCEATLRVNALDFWEHQRDGGGAPSPRYFRWEFYVD